MAKKIIPIVRHTFTDKLNTLEGLKVDSLEIYKRGEPPALYRSDCEYPYRIRIKKPYVLSVKKRHVNIYCRIRDVEVTTIYADEKIRVFKDGKEFILKW